MLSGQSSPSSASPLENLGAGTLLLRRGQAFDSVFFIEAGRVGLGLLSPMPLPADAPHEYGLEHQLGTLEGPAWLEASAAVLSQTSAVDAVAQTPVTLRRVPLAVFQSTINAGPLPLQGVLSDVARAHRQQTELTVSRLAKDAEARCAEWLLRHAQINEKGACAVQLQQRKRMIAAQLGIAPETLSRVLRHLRERSFISGSGRTVQLVDMGGLRSLAGV